MAELNPLRRRMIEDMKVRNLSPVTQRCYVHAVAKFAQYRLDCKISTRL
jgi:integrase/recombinase XerD